MDVLESGCRSLSRRLEAVWRPVCFVISKVPDFTQSVQLLMLVFSEKVTEPKKSFLQNPHNIFSLKYQGQVCN